MADKNERRMIKEKKSRLKRKYFQIPIGMKKKTEKNDKKHIVKLHTRLVRCMEVKWNYFKRL